MRAGNLGRLLGLHRVGRAANPLVLGLRLTDVLSLKQSS